MTRAVDVLTNWVSDSGFGSSSITTLKAVATVKGLDKMKKEE